MAPIRKPYTNLPFSVREEVTGSVAINTAPKQKPPKHKCSNQGILAIAVSGPMVLKIHPITAPPTNTDNIVFQLATPDHNRITAPIAMAITLVSPIEPGIRPVTISQEKAGYAIASVAVEACPSAVAAVRPSTLLPKPKMLSLDTHTVSPDILVG